jgi:ribulose 1,5-bisphosphate synthetase/thiazole synthase
LCTKQNEVFHFCSTLSFFNIKNGAVIVASLSSVTQWDLETDILILGFGLAGASAGIEALDTDPDVKITICEKNPEKYAGGNSRASGQSLLIAKNPTALKAYQKSMSTSNPIPEDMLDE